MKENYVPFNKDLDNLDNADKKKSNVSTSKKQVKISKSTNENDLLDDLLTKLKVPKKIDYLQAFKNP
ncbi:TPA: hypothetical protein EYP13_04020 [Candidatus Micrarchaeota archaeon]|nr:hypothetical protein [Candidatus Micrarchaeota archaeon]